MPVLRRVNKDFFKKWTPDMAYVLGFFAADGNLVYSSRGAYYLAFHTSDRDLLELMRNAMQSTHKLAKRNARSGNVYRLQIGSKEIFADLVSLGFSLGKTHRMIMPCIPEHCVNHFVRGYFDGDGNVWVGYLNKRRKTPTRVLQAAFTSGSVAFLEGLLALLRANGVRGGMIYHSKRQNFSRLQFSTSDALKLAEIMYNERPKLHLERKKLRFEQFIKLRE